MGPALVVAVGPLMGAEVARLAELTPTIVAFIRLQARVAPHVDGEVVSPLWKANRGVMLQGSGHSVGTVRRMNEHKLECYGDCPTQKNRAWDVSKLVLEIYQEKFTFFCRKIRGASVRDYNVQDRCTNDGHKAMPHFGQIRYRVLAISAKNRPGGCIISVCR